MLRSRLAILPQEPFFVPGNVRQNLLLCSAFNHYKEKEKELAAKIESTVRALNLWEKILDIGGLDAILEPEKMLSQGERQLFCLARALLNPSPVLILDEATSRYMSSFFLLFQSPLYYIKIELTALLIVWTLEPKH